MTVGHPFRFRRALTTKSRSLQTPRCSLLQLQVLVHLFRVAISLALLPLDNTILLAAYAAGYFPFSLTDSNKTGARRRAAALRDSQFKPRTVLVTGIDTPYGLAIARGWYYSGHRVFGAEVVGGDDQSGVACGESMSRVLSGYYRITTGVPGGTTKGYAAQILDVVMKENVDVWIPCSEETEGKEDAVAKGVIEARTGCKCVTLDRGMVDILSQSSTDREAFLAFLVEKGLPVVERHEVLSRDAVHKILHRSPTKVWNMRRADDREVMLPKRTLSLTYSEVSEIRISRERPWMLQQQTRLGGFYAEMAVVAGKVKATKIYPAEEDGDGGWGQSPMDRGLATAIQALMERFASQMGARLTGHLRLKVMVDEEVSDNCLRYVILIDSCTHGASAVKYLILEDDLKSLVDGYLEALTPQTNGVAEGKVNGTANAATATASASASASASSKPDITTPPPRRRFSLFRSAKKANVKVFGSLGRQVDRALNEGSKLLFFWKNQKFSQLDPLPWWWHAHVYQPLRELEMIVKPKRVKRA